MKTRLSKDSVPHLALFCLSLLNLVVRNVGLKPKVALAFFTGGKFYIETWLKPIDTSKPPLIHAVENVNTVYIGK